LFPVHIFETEPLDFTYPQSIYSEQQQDGSITDVDDIYTYYVAHSLVAEHHAMKGKKSHLQG